MFTLPTALPSLHLSAKIERWPIAGHFTISRGSKTEAAVIVCTLSDGVHTGKGECVPYSRYGETLDSVLQYINQFSPQFASGEFSHLDILQFMKPGAARNAVDCALWDYFAKSSGKSIQEVASLSTLKPETTAYTISLSTPEEMAQKTKEASDYSLLKIKLGGDGDDERMLAVREAAPNTRLIADANEAWDAGHIEKYIKVSADAGYELVEQPLPEQDDLMLEEIEHLVPICADESCHGPEHLKKITRRYDAINIKLDKTGGFSEALKLAQKAASMDLKIMIGCMVGTSLSMAPALYLAQYADWIDLDGPLLLKEDRASGLVYEGSTVMPPSQSLWG